jgi:CheY-like chemotaxis protein/anti-sigma regulatory factor (Ser/Thr protein kinase)
LVNDILDISKIEAGKFELNLNEYATPSLLNDTITNNILRIGEKPIEFILNIPDNLPALLYGDDLRIKQILSNLLSNAFKYTKQGIVELGMDCTREDGTVWLTAWVSDTGIGIKPEDIGNLFSDYTQMDTKLNKLVEGTGLGLPIVKKLTELMDGTISVESEYGKGSKFIVHIKQKHVSDDTIGQETANNLRNFRYTNQRRTKNAKLARVKLPYARVLVVDDNATNLDVARGLMKPYGMQIDTATSGQQAIDAIRGGIQYTAVFMDHMMPGMDGIEAAERIRALGTDYARTVPLIALTANAIAGNEALFLSKGFQDFLSKPIDLARLDAVIRLWVRDKSGENRPLQRNDGETPLANYHIDGIDLAAGLDRFGGDWDAYRRVLRSYAANTRGLLSSLRDVGVQNIGDYAITVHGIKGSSRSIGADSVGALAETLEKAAMDRNIDTVLNKAPEFAKIVAALIDGIDALLTGAAAGTPKPVKEKPDQQVLARIYEACQAYDMETVEAAIKELEQYEYEQDGEIVPWLWENAQQFNVAEITARLQ